MKLLESHLVSQKLPAELGLVVNVRDLFNLVLGSRLGLELLGHVVGRVLELLEELGGDGQVVDTGKGLDLADLGG